MVDAQPNAMFVVELDGSGHKVLATVSGKSDELHTNPARNRNKVELSPLT